MPQGATYRVEGLREFLIACDNAGKDTKWAVRGTFRKVGDVVKVDAAEKMDELSSKSAAGYRTYVRRRGVEVEQSLRKTTGMRPDWGRTQMRKALVPALEENAEEVVAAFDHAIDRVCERFERTP